MGSKPSAATIVDMLEVAYDLVSFDLPFGVAGDAGMQAVFECAVDILADRAADRIRRGLYRRYVTKVEDLFFDHEPEAARRGFSSLFGQDTYLRCSYRSELPGLEDNLILMWTLYAASRMQLRSPGLRQKVEHGWRTLAGTLAMTEANAMTGLRRVYDRLAVDERPLHGLCRLVLEHAGPQQGSAEFRLSMPALYAAYAVKWARVASRRVGSVAVDYDIQVRPGFRLAVDPVLVMGALSTGGSRGILWPVYEVSSLTDATLCRIARRAAACEARFAVVVSDRSPSQLPQARNGLVLRSLMLDPGGDLSAARDALLGQVGCAGGGTPVHRPIGS